jgi:hypothetical protein
METPLTTAESPINLADMFGGSDVPDQDVNGKIKKLAEFITIEDDAVDTLEENLKMRKANLDALKADLATLMLTNGMSSVKLDNGLTPSASITTKFFKAAGVEDEAQLFPWLEQNNLGGIIKRTVHFSTLNSTLRDFVEQGNHLPDGIFTVSEQPTIRMNGKSKFLAGRKVE